MYKNDKMILFNNFMNKITSNKKINVKKINNKVYNSNTNTYKNIIYNKKEITVSLFN